MNHSTSLMKALDLLSLLATRKEGVRVSEMTEAMNLPRSSVTRILNTLVMQDFVDRTGKRFVVTPRFEQWAVMDRHAALRRQYRSALQAIARGTGELALIGVQEGAGVVHIDYIESDQAVRVAPAPLTRHNIRHNALGKLCLAMRPDLSAPYLEAEPDFAHELKQIRHSGIAWNREETVKGMIALAGYGFSRAPHDAKLAIAWPKERFTEDKGSAAIQLLREVTAT